MLRFKMCLNDRDSFKFLHIIYFLILNFIIIPTLQKNTITEII